MNRRSPRRAKPGPDGPRPDGPERGPARGTSDRAPSRGSEDPRPSRGAGRQGGGAPDRGAPRADRGPSRPGDDAPSAALYGRNPIHEALRAGRRKVHRVYATSAAAREPWLEGVEVRIVDSDEVAARCGSTAHQGMCADAAPYPYADEARLLRADVPFLVALDEVQDPQNVGAIARTAECAGATGLILPRHRSAEVTAAVCKASAGAVEHLPVAQVRNVADFLVDAKAAGCWVYGADAGGVPHTGPDFSGPVVLVLGAEGKGLRPRVRQTCDAIVALPLRGRIASLNVAAAAAVLLYEVLEDRDAPKP